MEQIEMFGLWLTGGAIPVMVILHELGHYFTARLLGCNAVIHWELPNPQTEYITKEGMQNKECYLISFMGIIGNLAFLPGLILAKDFVLTIFILGLNIGYSFFEVYKRTLDLEKNPISIVSK